MSEEGQKLILNLRLPYYNYKKQFTEKTIKNKL